MATVMTLPTPVATISDVRPVIPRNRTNLWVKAEQLRDAIYNQFAAACQRAELEPLLLASGPSVFPAWVKFEAWVPVADGTRTERSSVHVVIEPQPYHKHEFELEVTYATGNRRRTVRRVAPFTNTEVEQLLAHLLHGGSRPALRRFRQLAFQLWRPRNKIQGLRRDYLAIGMSLSVVGAVLLIRFWPLALALGGLAVFLFTRIRRRRWIVLTEGKPETEPRSLVRVDSWQSVIFGLADEQPAFTARLLHALKDGLGGQCSFHSERVWYWGLDGKEEREQLLLTGGRGLVFCQVYRYGNDLYVGWDGHLNRGQWVEQTVVSGIDDRTGRPISMTRVVPGTQPTTEYDLTDLSCLMEWTHAQLVRLLKHIIAEKQIDQEIDFKIQRAERRDVVATGGAASTSGAFDKVRSALRRTA